MWKRNSTATNRQAVTKIKTMAGKNMQIDNDARLAHRKVSQVQWPTWNKWCESNSIREWVSKRVGAKRRQCCRRCSLWSHSCRRRASILGFTTMQRRPSSKQRWERTGVDKNNELSSIWDHWCRKFKGTLIDSRINCPWHTRVCVFPGSCKEVLALPHCERKRSKIYYPCEFCFKFHILHTIINNNHTQKSIYFFS